MAKHYNDSTKIKKIGVFFRRSFLIGVMRILAMNSDMYRSFKAVKNINKLFTSIDMDLYKKDPELAAYIWCIQYFSAEWLKGVTTPDLIAEMAIRRPECDSLKRGVIEETLGNEDLLTPQEAKEILDIVSRSLQDGYIYTLKDELIQKLEDFDITDMTTTGKAREDVINAARAITDVYNSTTVISDQNTFNTNDTDTVDYGVDMTIDSLKESSGILRTGIKRLNTLLSPGYLNGRLYVYEALPAGGKACPDNTLIPTPAGLRRLDSLRVGDTVFDECGDPTTVTGVFPQGIQDTYEVTFSDHRVAKCNIDHLWKVYRRDSGRYVPRIMTLGEIMEKYDEDHPFFVPNNGVARFDPQNVDTDPFVIGCTLRTNQAVSIPPEYIFNTADVRIDLLSGLREIGSTGSTYTWMTTSQSMCDDIQFVMRSLAMKYECRDEDGQFTISADYEDSHYALMEIVDIKKVEPTSQRCILVSSPEHMYLTNDFIPTHNSLILLKSALDIRRYNLDYKPRVKGMIPCVLYITMENSLDETIERLWNMIFDDPITHFSKEEAREMLKRELGVSSLEEDMDVDVEVEASDSLLDKLNMRKKSKGKMTIHIVIRYFEYRSKSTSDLYTIIQDLADEKHMEVICLILDYIKRIEPSIVSHESVKLELNRIVNELKALAVTKNIPVITAHQLNRAAAATVDAALRQGQSDVSKLVGRENTGDASTFRCV